MYHWQDEKNLRYRVVFEALKVKQVALRSKTIRTAATGE
jgi:hypothetical protein